VNQQREQVRVRLSCLEASSILVLSQNGSFPMGGAGLSASDKVRRALVATGFDPDTDVELECTEEEARFLARGREA
jgi:hypothetical protein